MRLHIHALFLLLLSAYRLTKEVVKTNVIKNVEQFNSVFTSAKPGDKILLVSNSNAYFSKNVTIIDK